MKEHCPNCHREVELKRLQGKDLLDPVQSILCVIIPLISALGVFVCIRLLGEVFQCFIPRLGIICIIFAAMLLVFIITFRLLIAFEKRKLESLGVAMYHLDCSCIPQNHIVVVRPTTNVTKDESSISNVPETLE